MNVLSLFDGISTGRYSLDQAGIRVDNYFSSEIDPNAIKISEKNYPDIIRLGDVSNIDTLDLPRIDLVIGGSPCQGFSRAGKCLNFDDPRSKLFFEYVRILNEIREYNPNVKFLLENVKMKKEWSQVITDHLDVAPIEINSKVLSAQNRPRDYWTNIPVYPIEKRDICLEDIIEEVDTTGFIEKDGLLFEPGISEASRNLVSVINGEVRIKQSTKLGYIVAEDYDGINLDFPTSKSRRGRVIHKKSPTITRVQNTIGIYYRGIFRHFTITEIERLQTLPDGYTEGVSLSARKEALGNGWTADVITHIFKGLSVSAALDEVAV